jgi:hypothetical protein
MTVNVIPRVRPSVTSFPKLMQYAGNDVAKIGKFVVLFNNSVCGMVLDPKQSQHQIGTYREDWAECFQDLDESIILSN